MGLDKVIIRSLAKVSKDTGKLNAALDGIRDKIKDTGLFQLLPPPDAH